MKKYSLILIILFYSTITNAEPKLFSSDWPVWSLTEGMNSNGMLEGFDYRFKSYETSLAWFKAGNLDITFMTLYDFISIQPTKVPTVILGVTDYSNGGDKIIVRNDIKEPADLKGKKVLLANNTISLWLLHNYLEANGLNLNDVIIVNQKDHLAPLQFKEDLSFSAVVGWNPNIDKALSENSYVASTSADFPRVIYDLIVAKKSTLNESPNLVERFTSNYYKCLRDDSVIEKTATSFSVSGNEFKSWLGDANIFPSRKAANDEHNHLVENAKKIKSFLTVVPKSLKDEETKKRFKERDLELEKLIEFRKNVP